jgi:hypothetical protein
MVFSLAAAVPIAIGAGACAQLSGLEDYSSGAPAEPDSSVSPVRLEPKDAAGDESHKVTLSEAGDDVNQGADSPPEDLGPRSSDDAGEAAETGDAGEPSDGAEPSDAARPSDASLVPDGYVCGAGTCGGCCNAEGDCVGGQSVATCGVGGAKCADCTSSGACSEGSCTTSLPDAGPRPKCKYGSCPNSNCAFFPIQGACCKLDQTCGCQWTVFAPCL